MAWLREALVSRRYLIAIFALSPGLSCIRIVGLFRDDPQLDAVAVEHLQTFRFWRPVVNRP